MKTKKNILMIVCGCVLVLLFQNCSDFGVQDEALYQQSLYDYQTDLDNELLPKNWEETRITGNLEVTMKARTKKTGKYREKRPILLENYI